MGDKAARTLVECVRVPVIEHFAGRHRVIVLMLAAWKETMAFDNRKRLAEIRCPTLVIAGSNDQGVPKSTGFGFVWRK